jgi:acyl carrier protein
MGYADAASMLVVYLTAIRALVNIGRLEAGQVIKPISFHVITAGKTYHANNYSQSILVHSGCGGVGLAAIQLAHSLGLEIYTTVSSASKSTSLTTNYNIPPSHIFNSRSASFADDILRATNGRGVDMALNSLPGDLLHATWHSVAKRGTMVEIGKADLLGGGKLDMGAIASSSSSGKIKKQEHVHICDPLAPITSENTIMVGISPQETAGSGSRLSDNIHITTYLQHNQATTTNPTSSDSLHVFLARAKANPAVYREPGAGATVAREVSKKPSALLLRPDEEPNIALTLAELGLDSLVAVEMRAWIKKAFRLEIGVLEMLGMGTLEALGGKVAGKLAEVHGV